jgi:hypothetical protein
MDLKELIDKRNSLFGVKVIDESKHLGISFAIFLKNSKLILDFLKMVKNDDTLFLLEKRDQLKNYQIEGTRLLQNYLSSIYCLVGHAESLKTRLASDKLDIFFVSEVTKLKESTEIKFIMTLRQYSHHYLLPLMCSCLEWSAINESNKGESKQYFYLPKTELLRWSSWNRSKHYLDSLPENITLDGIIEKVTKLESDFFQNFFRTIDENFADDIKELKHIEDDIREWLERNKIGLSPSKII